MIQPASKITGSPQSVGKHTVKLEIEIAGNPVVLCLDKLNERVIVLRYDIEDIIPLVRYLHDFALLNGFSKVIVVARDEDWQHFIAQGYVLEGVNNGQYQGRPGYYVAKFYGKQRHISTTLPEEDDILRNVLEYPANPCPPALPAKFILRDASPEDVEQMALLYKNIFSSYPSPITEYSYLQNYLTANPFKIILHGDRIVGAASAETDRANMTAEITDCACLTEYRGQGLVSCAVDALEQDLLREGVKNFYSIARAKSPGINTVLRKLGYTYGGRLINNCTICGQFEDMNLWFKKYETSSSFKSITARSV